MQRTTLTGMLGNARSEQLKEDEIEKVISSMQSR